MKKGVFKRIGLNSDDSARGRKLAELKRRTFVSRIKTVTILIFLGFGLMFAYDQVGFSLHELAKFLPDFLIAMGDYFPTTAVFGLPILDFGRYWSFIQEEQLFRAAIVTVSIAFAGTLMGTPGAFLLGVLGSERVTPFPFNFIFRSVMSIIRSIPALVWALIFIPLGGVSPLTGTLAITVDTMGYLGRLFTDELEEIDTGVIEGVASTGASKPQTVIFGMISQVARQYLAWFLFILEFNVRVAVQLGLIGAGGLGYTLLVQRQTFNYTNMMATILVVIVVVLSVEITSTRIRARLRKEEAPGIIELILGLPERLARMSPSKD
ncbi:phosphonate ABC transporter, permease protein PhnE [Haloarcula sp. H-GB4]|uniref:phosphonate ABC transporter, permease protein PhnE n=1 Tax=Haloarcula sp. H-GB4 TaxID=3069755 RepID=UPI0027B3FFBE|nr:phosphonate ABC transporter, permease protein PhnE [Haloarcula sp. H-GB4]MDQ2074923.1 phosphonate ABC transporter, permease protein PhnE [Haloarcula sp. H-GB4]